MTCMNVIGKILIKFINMTCRYMQIHTVQLTVVVF